MWRNTPLRRRLNLVFAALIALWLVGDIARILTQAQPRIAAETRAVTRLTQEFLVSSLDRVQTAPDPQEAVLSLVSSLRYLRHVRVAVGEGALAASMAPAPDEDCGGAGLVSRPGWRAGDVDDAAGDAWTAPAQFHRHSAGPVRDRRRGLERSKGPTHRRGGAGGGGGARHQSAGARGAETARGGRRDAGAARGRRLRRARENRRLAGNFGDRGAHQPSRPGARRSQRRRAPSARSASSTRTTRSGAP